MYFLQAADALLPVLLCEPAGYHRIGQSLLAGQGDESTRARVAEALESLVSGNGLQQSVDRVNLRRFRRNLHSFLGNVRGLFRTK